MYDCEFLLDRLVNILLSGDDVAREHPVNVDIVLTPLHDLLPNLLE